MGSNQADGGHRPGGTGSARAHFRKAFDLVQQTGLVDRMGLRRTTPLPDFLSQLQDADPRQILEAPAGSRDSQQHLGQQWSTTAVAVSRPETLPAVVERRSRIRVHPAAPWSTAAVAAAGAGAVVAGPWPGVLEAVAVAGVAGVVSVASGWLWRPRTSRRDRRHTVTGAAALAARADVLVVQHASLDGATTQALLARVHGSARAVESVEAAAASAGLLDGSGNLSTEAKIPAHRQVVDELLRERAELTHLVLRLQQTAQAQEARMRQEDRASYQRLLDDLDEHDI